MNNAPRSFNSGKRARVLLGVGLACLCLTGWAAPTLLSSTLPRRSEVGVGRGRPSHARGDARRAGASEAVLASQGEAETSFVHRFSLATTDLVSDRGTRKLYASRPSWVGAAGNSITTIDPATRAVEKSVFVGSEPGKMALSDDGLTLYVSLDGAAAVRRFDPVAQKAGRQFALGDDLFDGPLYVKDMAVMPGSPDTVAVSRKANDVSPDFKGVAVYDNGVRRAATTPVHTGSDFIAFSNSAATLYGASLDGLLQKMSVSDSGVAVVKSTEVNTATGDFKVDNGLMFMPTGETYNPETQTLVGTFSVPRAPSDALPLVEPDSSVGRAYFLTGQAVYNSSDSRTVTLRAYDLHTFLPVGTLDIPDVVGPVSSLVRWGANGLAFRSADQVIIIQTTLVPSSEAVPTPTPTPSPKPSPTPTPVPTPAPGDLRHVDVTAKDIVLDPNSQTVYASVPSSAGAGGNSITSIDPVSGSVGQPVFVGSEPGRMAISDDGKVIYVSLDGAKAVRRFDVATATPGLQFSLGGDQLGQFSAADIAVAPGGHDTVAVLRFGGFGGGVAIYDGGVQRPLATGGYPTINAIEYSASPSVLYGQDTTTSGGAFTKMAAPSCGVSILSSKAEMLISDFKVENGLAYAINGRVADPEAGTLVGTYLVGQGLGDGLFRNTVVADSKVRRVYFLLGQSFPTGPQTVFLRVFDQHTFLPLGTLAIPNVLGSPTAMVRWGDDGLAFRTTADQVYLLQSSLIPAAPVTFTPAPSPTPPTFTLRGQVSTFNGPQPPTVTLNLSGGQTGTTTTNPDGTFSFKGLPFCADFTVTPSPLENYTFSPESVTVTAANQNDPNFATAFFNAVPKLVGFTQSSLSVGEGDGSVKLTVVRSGDTSGPATVFYQTEDGTASERSDYTAAVGTLSFAPNESSKQITVFITDDARAESPETFKVTLSDPGGAMLGAAPEVTVTITDNDPANGTTNPIDDPQFYVRQHYRDFLGRDPDAAGLAFWTAQTSGCGSTDPLVCRVNVSAAFFLSIEFQETGYLAYKTYGAAFGTRRVGGTVPLTLREFLADAQEIGAGVVVNQGDWQTQLENNKRAYFADFVSRPAFVARYPANLTAAQFVDSLNSNAGGVLTQAERDGLVSSLGAGQTSRAQALREVAENAAFSAREKNRAFVLMQYFGYLRRDPNAAPDQDFSGYSFWLSKLEQFGGDFVQAEMVKAFISSAEYRQRFGQ